ncbi:MAG: hypothetical protein OCC45_12285 [Desulfotalea sp.]
MTISPRPLGLVKQIIDATGLSITHVWDNLVFIEHNAFILQFGDKGEDILLHFNKDSEEDKRDEITEKLITEGKKLKLIVSYAGTYSLTQKDDENIDIEFHS